MQQNYQDAMALVRTFGFPDYFITMTANPAWPETWESLFSPDSDQGAELMSTDSA